MLPFDYSRLRGSIKTKYGTEGNFAKALNLSQVSLSGKLNNRVEFGQDEIKRCCDLLEIKPSDISVYFFTPQVKETKLYENTKAT